jgi:hypothetical protein
LDGTLAIPEIFEWHSLNNPDHCLFQYATEDGVENITYEFFSPAFHRAGKYVREITGMSTFDDTHATVIAILATSGIVLSEETINPDVLQILLRQSQPCWAWSELELLSSPCPLVSPQTF